MDFIFYRIMDMIPVGFDAMACTYILRTWAFDTLTTKRNRSTVQREMAISIFVGCIAALLTTTVFCGEKSYDFSWYSVNMIPGQIFSDAAYIWKNYRDYFPCMITTALVLNPLAFMPIGFFIPLLWEVKKPWIPVGVGFFTSLAIEFCQISMRNRVADIDDLIMCTLGAFLGYLIYSRIRKKNPSWIKKFRLQKGFYVDSYEEFVKVIMEIKDQ